MKSKNIGCGNLQILTEEETVKEFAKLGLTPEQAQQPTSLELDIEYRLERMNREEYEAACKQYGYPVAA